MIDVKAIISGFSYQKCISSRLIFAPSTHPPSLPPLTLRASQNAFHDVDNKQARKSGAMFATFTSILPNGLGFSSKEEKERDRERERQKERENVNDANEEETPKVDQTGSMAQAKEGAVDELGVKKERRRERSANEVCAGAHLISF